MDLIKSFFVVVELGSLNRAAERLSVSQSTLTRQMQALEQEVGGTVFERTSSGVALTATGQVLADAMRPAMESVEAAMQSARRMARGQRESLRIGYIASAAADYLNAALSRLRKERPDVRAQLLDMSPGQQMEALRAGEIDVALIGSAGALLSKEFYTRKLGSEAVFVAVSETSPLAGLRELAIEDLLGQTFIGAAEEDMPGFNAWVTKLCRQGGFRPRFAQDADSLSHSISLVVVEDAVVLLPGYVREKNAPGVRYLPLVAKGARWDIYVAWQRGKLASSVKCLLDAFTAEGLIRNAL